MRSLAVPRTTIAEWLAGTLLLALGLPGCIDTTKMAGPEVAPPQETPLARSADVASPQALSRA